ncbi:MAG TPA: HXXEE domain-containing protein [Pyrinomonadaceae bacterium]|nr:HXXEE domain-containing protein [Pyrinomonadaceae bacterium]
MSSDNHDISTSSQGPDGRSLGKVLWLLPLIFIIHDGEELLTMPSWLARHQRELDKLAQMNETAAEVLRSLPTTTQVAVAIGSILLLFVVVTAGASISRGRGFWLYAYATLLGVLFLHVFTHIAQAILFGGYAPGVIGAVVAIIPGALYLYKRLFEARLLTVKSSIVTALIGFALFIPGAMLAHQIGQTLGGK